jgi:hypothetical protein
MKIETYVLSFVVLVIVISSIVAGIALADQNASPNRAAVKRRFLV